MHAIVEVYLICFLAVSQYKISMVNIPHDYRYCLHRLKFAINKAATGHPCFGKGTILTTSNFKKMIGVEVKYMTLSLGTAHQQ